MTTPMTPLEFVAIKPGWRLRYQSPLGAVDGVVAQRFGDEAISFAPDGLDRYVTVTYDMADAIEVIDTSGELEIEVVQPPWGDLSLTERLGGGIEALTHEDPVQSGAVNSVVATSAVRDPKAPQKASRVLAVLYPPCRTETFVEMLEVLTGEFPKAFVSQDGGRYTIHTPTEKED